MIENLLISQKAPVYPVWHKHRKLWIVAKHRPPFMQLSGSYGLHAYEDRVVGLMVVVVVVGGVVVVVVVLIVVWTGGNTRAVDVRYDRSIPIRGRLSWKWKWEQWGITLTCQSKLSVGTETNVRDGQIVQLKAFAGIARMIGTGCLNFFYFDRSDPMTFNISIRCHSPLQNLPVQFGKQWQKKFAIPSIHKPLLHGLALHPLLVTERWSKGHWWIGDRLCFLSPFTITTGQWNDITRTSTEITVSQTRHHLAHTLTAWISRTRI